MPFHRIPLNVCTLFILAVFVHLSESRWRLNHESMCTIFVCGICISYFVSHSGQNLHLEYHEQFALCSVTIAIYLCVQCSNRIRNNATKWNSFGCLMCINIVMLCKFDVIEISLLPSFGIFFSKPIKTRIAILCNSEYVTNVPIRFWFWCWYDRNLQCKFSHF